MATRKRKDRGALFIRSNLELLGFGTRRDALVQAVKELFENALDATQSLSSACSWDDAPLELLRVSVTENDDTGCVDIVCADTGSGMHAHQIKLLCCNAFETTKASSAGCSSGKFGVGLKAAMLYSQLHASDACLKITTTSNSNGILHVQLRIDPDSEETAVVRKVVHFAVDEDHHEFSGTEMRLSIPCPADTSEVENAADALALYFQSLRYTAPPFVGVEFMFDVNGISTSVECQHQEEPIDRFVADMGARADDILYTSHDGKRFSINCMALMLGEVEPDCSSEIEICLLRYANHAPMVNGDDVFLCGTTKGIGARKVWSKYGLRCRRTSSRLVNQLVATPLRTSNGPVLESNQDPPRLVLAIDVCIASSAAGGGIKYGSLKKSVLDVCYADGAQACGRDILQQLVDAGRLNTPQQHQSQDLLVHLAPLIAKSIATIANQANATNTSSNASSQEDTSKCRVEEDVLVQELQHILLN